MKRTVVADPNNRNAGQYFSIVGLFFSFVALFFLVVVPSFAVHDVQRVGQIVVATVLMTLFFFSSRKNGYQLRHGAFIALVLVFLLAAISSANARQPEWSVVEVSLLVISIWMAHFFAAARRQCGERSDYFFYGLIVAVCAAKTVQFMASSFAAYVSGADSLDLDLLVVGFSNKRFYGQFQTLTLPLIAWFLLIPSIRSSLKIWVFILLSCWWMIAISGGTRGVWVAMASTTVSALTLFGRGGRQWAIWQIGAAAFGILLFWIFFSLLPSYMGIEILNSAGDRLNASLSARDMLWLQAWEMIKQRPIFGYGPMHFADVYNPVAAHPHQAILQWASEWGIPSALIVIGLVVYGVLVTLRFVRRKVNSEAPADLLRICLLASVLSALAQSMIDGVIVMPYSQLWLSLISGWLMGIHQRVSSPASVWPLIQKVWILIGALSLGMLIYVVMRDVPHIDDRVDKFVHDYGGILQPRFWQQGVIAGDLQ